MVIVQSRRVARPAQGQLALRSAGALLLAISAGIHLDLYLTGYRTIPTIGWLFLLQVIAGFTLAAAAAATRRRLAAATAALFSLGTLGGYLLSVWAGLFGFREVRTTAGLAAGLIEVAAFACLALAAVGLRLVFAVSAVTVASLALLALAAATASAPVAARAGTTVIVRTGRVGRVTVLTNASGRTLYWFAPDTPTMSRCVGTCAAYWPPLTGSPKAGPGVTGRLGTITRPGGGATQVTYDGHPLYTYVGDTGPGQASGNNLDLNGGLWHEMRIGR